MLFRAAKHEEQIEYMAVVALGLNKHVAFPVTIAGANCNALVDMGASCSGTS